MKKRIVVFVVVLLQILLWYACTKADDNQNQTFIKFESPIYFPNPTYDFSANPVTNEGFLLGKQLFYEVKLSRNNTISCGTCHLQSAAFTHHGHDVSHGIEDRLGKRNALPIMNLAWYSSYMWDGGIFNLDLQPIAPITAHEEMDTQIDTIISKLSYDNAYQNKFKAAFGTTEITGPRLLKALSQFMLLCISANSKYDSVTYLKTATFSEIEQQGEIVFNNKCANCHTPPLFTNNNYANNGIGVGKNDDWGRYDVTLNPDDKNKFRVPSLRNISYTAPYMHDGRYITIDAVLQHYNNRMQQMHNNGTDSVFYNPNTQIWGTDISNVQLQQLKAFLLTLDDPTFLKNANLSEI